LFAFLRAKAETAIARLSHRNLSAKTVWHLISTVCLSVCPSVCPSVTRVDQSKTVQARITKSSPSTDSSFMIRKAFS